MEIIKELKRQERKQRVKIRFTKGMDVGIKIKGSTGMIKGKTIKQSSSYINVEIGRKKKRIVISIPKRKEIVEEITIEKKRK